mmetsp:Transcript_3200/g.3584  ORF Transcript_3200/g.3584 Transcript_3200/m.3584 type:complete len:246 (-) Transcript_3200:3795-4532(-)
MTQLNDESLSMFFDSDFNPSNYVDALFQSISNNKLQSQVYSKNNLQSLSNKCSNLVTHLDYHTSELSNDLINQIETLQNSSKVITQGLNNDEIVNTLNDMTRLQYFINTLNNSILLLQTDIKQANEELNGNLESQPESIDNLIKLKSIKNKLYQVLVIFERLNSININNPDSTTVESFQSSLNTLYDSIRNQLNNEKNEINQLLVTNINELINLLPLFQNLTNFYPIYKTFTNKLNTELENYLNK